MKLYQKYCSIFILLVIAFSSISCNSNSSSSDFVNEYQDPNLSSLNFYLDFDENKGNVVQDKVREDHAEIQYVFTNAKYKNNADPIWIKRSAVSGSSLSFDGYTNYIEYPSSSIQVQGKQLTVDVFVSPRMFEWDDPNARMNDNEHLQVIVGQYDKENNAGFVVGMYKYGDFSFQIGLGDRWVKLWNEWNYLDRYQWNHLTCVFNGETGIMSVYKNGELINYEENVFGSIQPSNNLLLIGKSQYPQSIGVFQKNMFNGLMDELKIYNIALNEEDIVKYHQSFYINGSLKEVIFEDGWLHEEVLEDDIYHPKYHAAPPQHWMNEPHALFYYNGNYHMFYQFNATGPYWSQICWGHWVSKDMVNWRNVKEAIVPSKNSVIKDGAWSGNMAYKADGTPVLFITAGDDARTFNPYSNQNIAIAVPKDLSDPDLIEWEIHDELVAVETNEMGKSNEFRDPNVYYEDGTYYMVVGSAKHDGKGTALLFTTQDDSFTKWDYQGHLFTPNTYYNYMGSTWELVNLVKVTNDDKTISKYLFAFSPAGKDMDNDVYYYLGNFDKQTMKFSAENEQPLLMDYGNNVFTGPTISTDPLTGRVLISSILQTQRTGEEHYDSGWTFMAGIPRELSLDDQGDLKITPLQELDNIKGETLVSIRDTSLTVANQKLQGIKSNQLYIHARMSSDSSSHFGFIIKKDLIGNKTLINYDVANKNISIITLNSGNQNVRGIFGGDLELINDETLDLEIFIDGATVECYINGTKTISAMVYNPSSMMEIYADRNMMIDQLEVREMNSI